MTKNDASLLTNKIDGLLEKTALITELVAYLHARSFAFEREVLIFGVQHIMKQTVILCWALEQLGIPYTHIALCGKVYSNNADLICMLRHLGVEVPKPRKYKFGSAYGWEQIQDLRLLAKRFAERKKAMVDPVVIVLDDGGHALANARRVLTGPYRVVGVEQTASGFWQSGIRGVEFPIVDVGASAVKRLCEPPLIVDAALHRVAKYVGPSFAGRRCGVLGLGYIGRRLAQQLLEMGAVLSVYDVRTNAYAELQEYRARCIHDVINSSDIIFGCSGKDVTKDMQEQVAKKSLTPAHRTFCSMSSGDDEFYSLKQEILSKLKTKNQYFSIDTIPDISASVWASDFTLVRNGFPVNFDNSGQSVPLQLIQGTVCALIVAICQAFNIALRNLATQRDLRVMLDGGFQTWLVDHWDQHTEGRIRSLMGHEPKMASHTFVRQASVDRTDPLAVDIGPTFDNANVFWSA